MDIIGNITGVINLAVKAKALADKTRNLDLKEAIIDLQSQLIDLKSQIVELREENQLLKEEVKKAKAPAEVIVRDGVYYKADGDGPFCTGCYDSKGKFSRITELNSLYRSIGKWRCPVCQAHYGAVK